jgi:hypothetical protein
VVLLDYLPAIHLPAQGCQRLAFERGTPPRHGTQLLLARSDTITSLLVCKLQRGRERKFGNFFFIVALWPGSGNKKTGIGNCR